MNKFKKFISSLLIFCMIFGIFDFKSVIAEDIVEGAFSNNFGLSGVAKLIQDGDEKVVRLTPQTGGWKEGGVYLKNKISLLNDFSFKGKVGFGTNKSNPGDGIGFLFHPGEISKIGTGGGNFGFGGLKNAFGFVIDTFDNCGYGATTECGKTPYGQFWETDDVNISYLQLTRHGEPVTLLKNGKQKAEFFDGELKNIELNYSSKTKNLEVIFIDNDGSRFDFNQDMSDYVKKLSDLNDGNPEVTFAVTAGLDAAYSEHTVYFNHIEYNKEIHTDEGVISTDDFCTLGYENVPKDIILLMDYNYRYTGIRKEDKNIKDTIKNQFYDRALEMLEYITPTIGEDDNIFIGGYITPDNLNSYYRENFLNKNNFLEHLKKISRVHEEFIAEEDEDGLLFVTGNDIETEYMKMENRNSEVIVLNMGVWLKDDTLDESFSTWLKENNITLINYLNESHTDFFENEEAKNNRIAVQYNNLISNGFTNNFIDSLWLYPDIRVGNNYEKSPGDKEGFLKYFQEFSKKDKVSEKGCSTAEIEEIDFETEEILTDELDEGETQLVTEGEKGEIEKIYNLVCIGEEKEINRKVKTTTIKEPVKEIIEIGRADFEDTPILIPMSNDIEPLTYSGNKENSNLASAENNIYNKIIREKLYTPYETQTVYNDKLLIGKTNVIQKGEFGETMTETIITYSVSCEQSEKELISEKIIKEPKNKVVKIGTGFSQKGTGETAEEKPELELKTENIENRTNIEIPNNGNYYDEIETDELKIGEVVIEKEPTRGNILTTYEATYAEIDGKKQEIGRKIISEVRTEPEKGIKKIGTKKDSIFYKFESLTGKNLSDKILEKLPKNREVNNFEVEKQNTFEDIIMDDGFWNFVNWNLESSPEKFSYTYTGKWLFINNFPKILVYEGENLTNEQKEKIKNNFLSSNEFFKNNKIFVDDEGNIFIDYADENIKISKDYTKKVISKSSLGGSSIGTQNINDDSRVKTSTPVNIIPETVKTELEKEIIPEIIKIEEKIPENIFEEKVEIKTPEIKQTFPNYDKEAIISEILRKRELSRNNNIDIPEKGETEIKKYPKILPVTGYNKVYEKVGVILNKLVETELIEERFRLAGSTNTDLNFWLEVLEERDHNKDKYIVLPKQGLVIPINSVGKEEIAYKNFINGKSENFEKYLLNGVVELPGTSTRGYGEVGNKVIGGHSSYFKNSKSRFKTDFQKIIEMEAGDEIWIYERNILGFYDRFIYKVTESYNTSKTDIEVLKPTDSKQLTLFTCTPIGGIIGRWIVKSEFVGKN